jgi:hypothetical protein
MIISPVKETLPGFLLLSDVVCVTYFYLIPVFTFILHLSLVSCLLKPIKRTQNE